MEEQMATEHLTEDDLVLHYYGEMPPQDESVAAAHLDACKQCRADYTRLQRVLGSVDEALVPMELPPSFERTVWARLEPNLRRQRRGWISWLVMAPAPLALAATVVLLVTGAFFAGRSLSPSAPAGPAVAPATAMAGEQIRERILLTDLAQHLSRSQMALVELVNNEHETSSDFSSERALAEDLVADNRLYRQTAEETGDTAVSDLLDEIDRVLTEIAAGPEKMSLQDLAAVRHRIESRDLVFKLRVVASALRERQKEIVRPKSGQRS
jgi:hypothetical protein